MPQNFAATLDEYLPDAGQFHRVTGAAGYSRTQCLFDLGNLFGDGRLRHVEGRCHARDLMQFGQADQHAQMPELQSAAKETFQGSVRSWHGVPFGQVEQRQS
ncbi:hypothetical protein L573_3436 [Bordetella holmesii H620]|nr:hypothetical protein L573_3436 [Bordetella holmesii H620]